MEEQACEIGHWQNEADQSYVGNIHHTLKVSVTLIARSVVLCVTQFELVALTTTSLHKINVQICTSDHHPPIPNTSDSGPDCLALMLSLIGGHIRW